MQTGYLTKSRLSLLAARGKSAAAVGPVSHYCKKGRDEDEEMDDMKEAAREQNDTVIWESYCFKG